MHLVMKMNLINLEIIYKLYTVHSEKKIKTSQLYIFDKSVNSMKKKSLGKEKNEGS